ncbi:hypothetical protein QFZ41_000657 [Luteibacter sp. W1I16]
MSAIPRQRARFMHGSASPSRWVVEQSRRPPPSSLRAAPSLGKGSRCAAVSDGWRPVTPVAPGGVFDSAPASAKTAGRPGRPPDGPFRPALLGSTPRAEGGGRRLFRARRCRAAQATPAIWGQAAPWKFPHAGGKRAGPRFATLCRANEAVHCHRASGDKPRPITARLPSQAERLRTRGPARFPPGCGHQQSANGW